MQCLTAEGTPLFGFLDLLLVDDAAKTVQIVDYKTGFGKEVPAGYHRQLKFYKLLVEASPKFCGYTVTSMGDYYVEPDKATDELRPPFATTANTDDITELEQLIDAVWSHIKHGAWDTSAFEQSDAYERALEEQKGCRKKADKAEVMQRAYEHWLVENPGM